MAQRKLPEGGLTLGERMHHLNRGRVVATHLEDGDVLFWRIGNRRFEVHSGLQGDSWTSASTLRALLKPDCHVTLRSKDEPLPEAPLRLLAHRADPARDITLIAHAYSEYRDISPLPSSSSTAAIASMTFDDLQALVDARPSSEVGALIAELTERCVCVGLLISRLELVVVRRYFSGITVARIATADLFTAGLDTMGAPTFEDEALLWLSRIGSGWSYSLTEAARSILVPDVVGNLTDCEIEVLRPDA